MEKSSHSSFLKSLALAFGDGLLFGVAMKLAQGPSKSREGEMTDLGPLAERLRKVEDHTLTIDKDSLVKFGEGLDGRVLEKVIVALEARLTEHIGQVDRRLAEIDAQVALDLKAVDTHTAAQTNAVEKAIQQIEAQVRDYVTAAQQSSAEQISGVEQKLSALQEALPAKFREIVEAVKQSMEARVALELTELENRLVSQGASAAQLQELQAHLQSEVEALSGKLAAEMRGLADHQQRQTAPLEQALQQLETKLTTLREELPPKIRQIVEAVEASMDARISAGDQRAADQVAALEHALAELRAEMPSAGGFQKAVDESLRRHAEQVGALDQKLSILQEELPPKIKAIVDAVRESLDARMAVELQSIEERHSTLIQQSEARSNEAQEQLRRQLAAESKTPALEESIAKLQAGLAAMNDRLEMGDRRAADHLAGIEQRAARITADVSAELESLKAQHGARIESAVADLRQSMEARLAAEIHALEARMSDRPPDLEKALQYASLLEARVQALEQKLQQSAVETVDRAVERVWQALEVRLQQRQAQAPPVRPPETISGLRQKSTSAEQSVLDLIAGIGQLFEKPVPRAAPAAPPAAELHAEPGPPAPVAVEPESAVAAQTAPAPEAEVEAKAEVKDEAETRVGPEPESHGSAPSEPAAQAPAAATEPAPEQAAREEPAPASVAATAAAVEPAEPKPDDKPPVILFRPKESGRKWRIPFVSSFLLMAVAIAWLQF